jgi:hypothetical protein
MNMNKMMLDLFVSYFKRQKRVDKEKKKCKQTKKDKIDFENAARRLKYQVKCTNKLENWENLSDDAQGGISFLRKGHGRPTGVRQPRSQSSGTSGRLPGSGRVG